jgi:hypothetical protein
MLLVIMGRIKPVTISFPLLHNRAKKVSDKKVREFANKELKKRGVKIS